MIQIKTAEDIYPALDELCVELEATGQVRLVTILHHRMYQVAWTARIELFEELKNILTEVLKSSEIKLHEELKQQMERILVVICESLNTES